MSPASIQIAQLLAT